MLNTQEITSFTRQSYQSDEFIIRPICELDIKQLYKWRTDPEINRYLYSEAPKTYDIQLAWYNKNKNQAENMYYMLFQKKRPDIPVGYCQLVKIDWESKTAETGLVTDTDVITTGIASIKLGVAMLRIAFEFLHSECVYSSVDIHNTPSRHFFESLINSSIVNGTHKYKKNNEILYKTDKKQFNKVLKKLLEMKSSRWRDALNLTRLDKHD